MIYLAIKIVFYLDLKFTCFINYLGLFNMKTINQINFQLLIIGGLQT